MKDDLPYLLHIRECITRIQSFTEAGRQDFFADVMIQDAVIPNLQILAESTQRLSESTRDSHPEVLWHGIAGFRNVVVHGYLGIDLNQIWLIMEHGLAELKSHVETILLDLDQPS